MEIEFKDQTLLEYYKELYSGKQKFSEDILKRYRDLMNYIVEAENINELSRLRSLNIEKYKDNWSARISKQYRLEFDFIKPNTIFVLKISKHYEK